MSRSASLTASRSAKDLNASRPLSPNQNPIGLSFLSFRRITPRIVFFQRIK